MSYFQKIANAVQKSSWDAAFLKNINLDALSNTEVDKEPYSKSELVYICISTTMRAISQVPLVIMQPARESKKGKAMTNNRFMELKRYSMSTDPLKEKQIEKAIKSGELEFASPDNPWQKLFDTPNQYMSGTELKSALICLTMLDGNVWLFPFTGGGQTRMPFQLWVLPRKTMDMSKTKEGHLDVWKYKPEGVQEAIPIMPEDIVHYKLWSPYNQIFGQAPIEAGRIAMRTDYKAGTYNEKFFDNSAIPEGIIYTEKGIKADKKERTQAEIDSKHKGYQNAHKLMLVDKALKYERIGSTMKEMDFGKLRQYSAATIYQIYGMRKAVISVTNDLNYATDKGQTKKWWTDTNLPMMRMVSSGINASPVLLAKTPYIIWWDKSSIEALQEDYKEKVEVGERLHKMGLRFTDINDMLELGFDERPEYDTGYISSTLVATNPAMRPKPEDLPVSDDKKNKLITFEAEDVQNAWEVKAENNWKTLNKKIEGLEKTFESKVSLAFYNMRKEVLQMVADFAKTVKAKSPERLLDEIDRYNFDKEKELIDKASAALYEQATEAGMSSVAEELGMRMSFDVVDPAVLQYIAIRRSKVQNVTNTVKRQISTAIGVGIKEGESIDEISRRIKDVFNMANKRAITIARTEVIGTTNFGRYMQMNQTAYTQRRWYTARDERVRESHARMNGKVRKIDQKWVFPDGSSVRYPGDYMGKAGQVINCRCVEVVVEESYDATMEIPSSDLAKEAMNPGTRNLTEAQIKAIDFASKKFDAVKVDEVMEKISAISGIQKETVEAAYGKMKAELADGSIPIQVNRRLWADSESYKRTLEEGRFKNQFELADKATSSGALAPTKGDQRDEWERIVFGGEYQKAAKYKKLLSDSYLPKDLAKERPTYGYLRDNKDMDGRLGGRYGEVSFVMKKDTVNRTTFTVGNSSWVATKEGAAFSAKNAAQLFDQWFKTKIKTEFDYNFINDYLAGKIKFDDFTGSQSYIEAQIHGGIDLTKDVEKIIVESKGYSDHIIKLAEKYGIKVEEAARRG